MTELSYTTEEGGQWFPAVVPDERGENIQRQCFDPDSWNKYNRSVDSRTLVTWHPGERAKWVHSVRFPDGRVWDSYFRDWRPKT